MNQPSTEQLAAMPEPGIHQNIPAEVYHAWPAVSKSRLWKFNELLRSVHTEEDLRRGMAAEKRTSALDFGRAVDDALFDRENFTANYGVSKYKTRCKAFYDAQESDPDQRMHVTEDEAETIASMAASVGKHPKGRELMAGAGTKSQVSVVWDDERTGLRCKMRLDHWSSLDGYRAVVDFKTCRDLDWFWKDALKFGYHVQDAHYLDGLRHADRMYGRPEQNRRFVFVVVESSPLATVPGVHRVDTFEYGDNERDSALRIRDVLLERWKAFFVEGRWPGRTPVVRQLYIPEREEFDYASAE